MNETDIEASLVRIYCAALKRLEAEIENYTVPQLIDTVYKLTAVQGRIQTMQSRQEKSNVGSTVRKYSDAFAKNDAGRRKTNTRGRLPTPEPLVALAFSQSESEYDES